MNKDKFFRLFVTNAEREKKELGTTRLQDFNNLMRSSENLPSSNQIYPRDTYTLAAIASHATALINLLSHRFTFESIQDPTMDQEIDRVITEKGLESIYNPVAAILIHAHFPRMSHEERIARKQNLGFVFGALAMMKAMAESPEEELETE